MKQNFSKNDALHILEEPNIGEIIKIQFRRNRWKQYVVNDQMMLKNVTPAHLIELDCFRPDANKSEINDSNLSFGFSSV